MKEKFIKSTIILMFGGLITKILGMVIKVVMTRIVGVEGVSLYMLVLPTFNLFMCLSQLGFPIAISKLVSEDRHNNKSIISSVCFLSVGINLLLMIIIILFAPYLSTTLLKEPKTYLPILAIGLVLPFDSLSSILRGYFFGKEKMFPHVISLITEQLSRIAMLILVIPTLLDKSIVYAVSGLILINMISEFVSFAVLFIFLPNKFNFRKSDFKINYHYIKDVLDISLPTTGGRLIGSISYFFEPIILTFFLSRFYDINYIILEYGVIEGYVMPLILLPSFFTLAISNSLLPVISKNYVRGNKKYITSKLKQALSFSLIIGLSVVILVFVFPEFFLKLLYNTNHGSRYLRFIAPAFIIYYLQAPLASFLQAIGKSNDVMCDNILGIISKTVIIILCSFFKIGLYAFCLGVIANILITTFGHIRHIKKAIKKVDMIST